MVTITKTGNAVQFSFDESSHYLYNGIIEVPVNSLSLTIDSSNMVTFRKAASNDAFLSITLEDLGMTKEEIATFFKEEMTGPTGGGGGGGGTDTGTVQSMINSSITEFYDGVQYDTNTKHINFLHGNTVKGYVDATAFIKDGMVDNVVVSGDNLVITFNTDAGKEPIEIPLTDIFNPANYYTKTQTDTAINAAVSGKADTTAMTAAISAEDAAVKQWVGEQGFLTEHQSLSAYSTTEEVASAISDAIDAEDTNVKQWVGEQGYLTEHQSLSAYSTTEEVASAISDAIDAEDTAVKQWVGEQGYLTEHQSLSAYSTTEEVASAISTAISAEDTAVKQWVGEQGYLTEHQSLSAYSTTDEVTADINAATSGKADSSAVTEEISNAVSGFVDSAEYDTATKRINLKHGQTVVSYVDATAFIKDGMVDNVEVSGGNLVITFNTDAGKEPISIPLTDIFDPANYYTTAQTDSAITAAVSGKADSSAVTEEISAAVSGKMDTSAMTAYAETTAVTAAVSGKQDTLTAGTGIDITNNVISVTGGGPTVVVDQTLDSGSTNPVANSAITQAINSKANKSAALSGYTLGTSNEKDFIRFKEATGNDRYELYYPKINGKSMLSTNQYAVQNFTLVEQDTYTAYTAATDAALSGKQDTLTAGTGIEISDNVISVTGGGGSVTVDPTLDSGSSNAVANSAITLAIDAKQDTLTAGTGIQITDNVISVTGGGGSVTVDPTLDSGSTNPVANSAITLAIDAKQDTLTAGTGIQITGDTISCTVTVDQTLDGTSSNAISNAAVATALGDIQTILDSINGD